jgi:hypothetical protein
LKASAKTLKVLTLSFKPKLTVASPVLASVFTPLFQNRVSVKSTLIGGVSVFAHFVGELTHHNQIVLGHELAQGKFVVEAWRLPSPIILPRRSSTSALPRASLHLIAS